MSAEFPTNPSGIRRNMLYGAVSYAAGSLGDEPVRSQGHVHRVSSHSGWSPPEVYEIWDGEAFIYMQEYAADDPGRCFAIHARPGDLVIVPPGWAHASISANIHSPVSFGALCDREYSFDYNEIRKRKGLAWYARVDPDKNFAGNAILTTILPSSKFVLRPTTPNSDSRVNSRCIPRSRAILIAFNGSRNPVW